MKKRRKRGTSLNAEIQASARQIYATGMAEAVRAAALGIVARKLDEVRAILNAAGLQNVVAVPSYAPVAAKPAQPFAPACSQCGRPAVRQAKRNRFIAGEPPWFCRIHEALAGKVEAEDAVDNAIIGPQNPAIAKKQPVVVQTNAPAVIRDETNKAAWEQIGETLANRAAEAPAEESPSDALKEALGLAQ